MKLSLPKLSLHRSSQKTERKEEHHSGGRGYGALLSSFSQISIKSLGKDDVAGKDDGPTTNGTTTKGLPPPSLSGSQFPFENNNGPSSDKTEDSTDSEGSSVNTDNHLKKHHPRVYRHQSSDHHEAVPAQLAASGQLHDHDLQKMALRKKQSSSISTQSTSEEAETPSSPKTTAAHRHSSRRNKNPRGHEHHKRRSHSRD